MPEFHSDSLVPQKYGVLSPFAKLTWFALIAIGVAVVSLFVFKFDLSRLRSSSHFIEKAHLAIDQKDWPAALNALQHIQGSNREKPEFLRVVADYLEATQTEPQFLSSVLDKLDARKLMLPVDFIWACRLPLAERKINLARKALDRIPAPTRSSAEALKLSIAILSQEGRQKEAAAEEARLFQLFPQDPEVILLTATRDLVGTFPEFQQAALKKLWALAEQPNEWGQKATRVLSEQSGLTLSEAEQLLNLADRHPSIRLAERLRVVSVILKADPIRREIRIHDELEHYKTSSLADQADLASWLAQEKEYDKVTQLISEEKLATSPELFPVAAQGLAEQRKWNDLMSLLKKGKKLPVSNSRAANWRALAAKNLNPTDTKEARAHLEEAMREGLLEKNAYAVSATAKLAEQWAMLDLALKAYESLAEPGSPQEYAMLEKCWQMASLLKDSGSLLKFSEKLTKLRPSNFQLSHQRDYLRLLLGHDIEMAANGSITSDIGSSDGNAALLLEALKAYRLNDRALTAKAIHEIRDVEGLTTGERAVYAGILVKIGDPPKAFAIAEGIRPELLLKEELVFLQMAL